MNLIDNFAIDIVKNVAIIPVSIIENSMINKSDGEIAPKSSFIADAEPERTLDMEYRAMKLKPITIVFIAPMRIKKVLFV